jgi:hypothetical protein
MLMDHKQISETGQTPDKFRMRVDFSDKVRGISDFPISHELSHLRGFLLAVAIYEWPVIVGKFEPMFVVVAMFSDAKVVFVTEEVDVTLAADVIKVVMLKNSEFLGR